MLVAEVISELSIEETDDPPTSTQDEEMDELKAGLEVDEETGASRAPKKSGSGGMKRLRFGKEMWEGDGEGKDECRWLRSVVGVRDAGVTLEPDDGGSAWLLGWDRQPLETTSTSNEGNPSPRKIPKQAKPSKPAQTSETQPSKTRPKIVMLDPDQAEDPLEGYSVPSPSSSRSASPTPSYFEEVAADPSLALDGAQKKAITRPVYVQQLVALLREREKPDHIEMGLKWGEGLVRAKRSFGGELGANSRDVQKN